MAANAIMKHVIYLVFVPAVITNDYSDINVSFRFEDLIKDMKAFKRQVDCYVDRGPCDPIPERYKVHIREEIEEACLSCPPALKHNIKTFLHALKTKLPHDYKLFRSIYDHDGHKFSALEKVVHNF